MLGYPKQYDEKKAKNIPHMDVEALKSRKGKDAHQEVNKEVQKGT